MKCIICGRDLDDSMGACPRCRFPVLYVVNEGEEPDDYVKKLALDYKKKLIGKTEISVETYRWKKAGDHFEMDQKADLPICDGLQLIEQGSVWNDTEFARTVSQKKIVLKCKIKNGSGERLEQVELEAPEDVSMWKIGAELLPGLNVRLCLRSDAACKTSEAIPLLKEDG